MQWIEKYFVPILYYTYNKNAIDVLVCKGIEI